MKFRRLKLEELEAAEREFLAFLAVNGITPDMWEDLKADGTKSNQLIDQFSDVYFQTMLEKVQYIDMRLNDELYCFHYQPSVVQLAHLSLAQALNWDSEDALSELQNMLASGEGTITVQSKNYQPDRETEMFRMLEQGGRISDGSWFKELALAFARQN